jgi:hypothetical protein
MSGAKAHDKLAIFKWKKIEYSKETLPLCIEHLTTLKQMRSQTCLLFMPITAQREFNSISGMLQEQANWRFMRFSEEPESIRACWDSVIPFMFILKRGDLFD